jgi:hypothetical protein
MIVPLSKEALEEFHRMDKIRYIWSTLSQEEKISTILECCGLESIQEALEEIVLDERSMVDELNEKWIKELEETQLSFETKTDKKQVQYLLNNLCFVDSLELWFEIENEKLANEILQSKIEEHEWFEVMPSNVIPEEKLHRRVLELASLQDEYFVSGIKQVLMEVQKNRIEDLTNEEQLMIYYLGQPTY